MLWHGRLEKTRQTKKISLRTTQHSVTMMTKKAFA
jgi:hypothetical protein